MVDFNEATTMTRPRKDIVNFMILQTLQDTLDSYQLWEENKDQPSKEKKLKSNLLKLVTLIRTPLEVRLKKDKKEIKDFRKEIEEANETTIYILIDLIEQFLYDKDVTKWDTKESVDRKDVWGSKQRYLG
jgi:hypothetical protein